VSDARELAGLAFARTGFERDDGRMDLSEVTGSHSAVLQAKRQSLMDLMNIAHYQAMLKLDIDNEKRSVVERLLAEAEAVLATDSEREMQSKGGDENGNTPGAVN
jgi:hypothetical protein